ncbi:MAG: TylF/MycF/NovP-related O-methyltransferase [Boseongicola sp.]
MRMVPRQMRWLDRDYFLRAREKWGKVTGIPDQRVFFLQSALQSLVNVPGDIAECGSRFGRSTLFLAETAQGDRDLHIFDSFEGLSDADPEKDPGVNSFKSGGDIRKFKIRNLDAVFERFSHYPNIHVHQGWIPERFNEVADKEFALVHVDVDLYQPTFDTLQFFWERLNPGGMVICDDYGSEGYPGAKSAFDEFFEKTSEKPVELPAGQAFVVKCH